MHANVAAHHTLPHYHPAELQQHRTTQKASDGPHSQYANTHTESCASAASSAQPGVVVAPPPSISNTVQWGAAAACNQQQPPRVSSTSSRSTTQQHQLKGCNSAPAEAHHCAAQASSSLSDTSSPRALRAALSLALAFFSFRLSSFLGPFTLMVLPKASVTSSWTCWQQQQHSDRQQTSARRLDQGESGLDKRESTACTLLMYPHPPYSLH